MLVCCFRRWTTHLVSAMVLFFLILFLFEEIAHCKWFHIHLGGFFGASNILSLLISMFLYYNLVGILFMHISFAHFARNSPASFLHDDTMVGSLIVYIEFICKLNSLLAFAHFYATRQGRINRGIMFYDHWHMAFDHFQISHNDTAGFTIYNFV